MINIGEITSSLKFNIIGIIFFTFCLGYHLTHPPQFFCVISLIGILFGSLNIYSKMRE